MGRTGLVVHLDIAPGKREAFVDIARRHGERSQELEPGCLGFDVLLPVDSPDQVILVEVYRDAAALEEHWASDHMKQYLERVDEMIVDRRRYRCLL